ncbi:MAG TPA: hypothetical protein EYG16_12205 [Deltaproteobacteria bacterium]|nr:hypothetical protein [Candidatus Binatota bacterium]HIL14415.1 hypothetical protein [Deltaproteobacteria bacterium]
MKLSASVAPVYLALACTAVMGLLACAGCKVDAQPTTHPVDKTLAVFAADLPRSGLALLGGGQALSIDGVAYSRGLLSDEQQWRALVNSARGSEWPALAGWKPQLDWSRQSLAWLAFDGATRQLVFEELREENGTSSLVFSARGLRRPDRPQGPVSLLLLRVDGVGGPSPRLLLKKPDGSLAPPPAGENDPTPPIG